MRGPGNPRRLRLHGRREGAADQHDGAVADVAGDHRIGQRLAFKLHQSGVDTVAEVSRRVDQRAIEVKDEQLQGLSGQRTKYANHVSSLNK